MSASKLRVKPAMTMQKKKNDYNGTQNNLNVNPEHMLRNLMNAGKHCVQNWIVKVKFSCLKRVLMKLSFKNSNKQQKRAEIRAETTH